MDTTVKGTSFVCAYRDDILITSPAQESHFTALQGVLPRFQKVGFVLTKEKCTFLAESVVYLGFKVDAKGLHPPESTIEAIKRTAVLTNVSALHSFIGLTN